MAKLDRKSEQQKEQISKIKAKKNARRKKRKAVNAKKREKFGGKLSK